MSRSHLRKAETQLAYDKYKKDGGLDGECGLCEANSIKDFDHWKITSAKFPHDKIAELIT